MRHSIVAFSAFLTLMAPLGAQERTPSPVDVPDGLVASVGMDRRDGTCAKQGCVRDGYAQIRNFDVLGIRSTPPAAPSLGDQYLVGFQPSGDWAAAENHIAQWNGARWAFLVPALSDQAYDLSGRQYVFTGIPSVFDGLWLDSRWRELTAFMPRWRTGGVISSSYAVAADDHAEWLVVAPGGSDVVLTLPSSFLPPFSGMRFILELDCSTDQTISLAVAGGGILQLPDGTQTTSAFDFDASACSNDSFVYEMVAGNTTSRAAWYMVPQQGPVGP